MDQAFNEIFREQMELYRFSQVASYFRRYDVIPRLPLEGPYLGLLSIVTEAIEAGVAMLGSRHELRADARLFLAVNLHQMVLMPLADARSPRQITEEVEQGIKNDAMLILQAASKDAGDRRQLTAGHVLKGTSAVLNQLTLKSWRLWD